MSSPRRGPIPSGTPPAPGTSPAPEPVARAVPPAAGAALHERVYADLAVRIHSGEFPPDARIPGERELSASYGVSRVTIRQAIDKARGQGLLTRVPGRGTFVAPPRLHQGLAELTAFRTSVEHAAMRPAYLLLSRRWGAADESVAAALDLAGGTVVLQIGQLGLANGRPMALYRAAIAPVVAAAVDAAIDAGSDRSTYELAGAALAAPRLRVQQTFEAISLDAAIAELLHVAPGSSAFRTSSVFRTEAGVRVEYRVAVYPGERYSFSAERTLDLDPRAG